MTIRHLNRASMRPALGSAMVAHCRLVERPDGLLLVDTGFGAADCADPARLGRPFRALVRPVLDRHDGNGEEAAEAHGGLVEAEEGSWCDRPDGSQRV